MATSAAAKLMGLEEEGYGLIGPASPARLALFEAHSLSELLSRVGLKRQFWDGDGFSAREIPSYSEIGDIN